MGLDVFAERAGVSVALQTAHHFATVGFVHIVRARVFEAVAGSLSSACCSLRKDRCTASLLKCRRARDNQRLYQRNAGVETAEVKQSQPDGTGL